MRFADAVEGFLTGYFSTCRRSGKTQSAYKIDLAQLRDYVGTDTAVATIESERLENWASDLRSRDYASVSIRRKFATARVFFSYWVRKGIIDRSPLWRIRLDLARERVLPRSLTPSDTTRLIEEIWRAAKPSKTTITVPRDPRFLRLRNLAALEILLATGMRVGELASLSLHDWRDDDSSFVVKGKGSRQRVAVLPDDRSIKAIQMYLPHRTAMKLDHDGLFINAAGGRLSTQGIARLVTHTAKEAGVATRVTPHMLRHTVATLLLRYGADIRVVQEVLGHASIATTQRYTHVSKDHLLSTLRAHHPNHHLIINVRARRNSNPVSA